MKLRNYRGFGYILLAAVLLLAACAGTTNSDTVDAAPEAISGLETEAEAATELLTGAPTTDNMDTAVSTPAASADDNNDQSVPTSGAAVDANGIEVGFTEDGRPYRGQRNAPIVLEEFSDYQCPFCARHNNQTLPALLDNQVASGEMVIIFYDFPLTSIHPQAVSAAHAARCAGEQGAAAYWEMHDMLFADADPWSNRNADTVFVGYAEELGLDVAGFRECQESNRHEDAIQADMALGRARGVSSTPSFFLNDQPLIGAQPLAVFNEAIATVQEGGELAANEPEPQPSGPAVAPTPATIPQDNVAGTLGDPDAPVTIVEYTDYQCPFCQRHVQQTMPQLISDMVETGRVYYVLKDFPLDQLHPQARAAAVAARCAGEQDAYWEMHDAIFAAQASWGGQANAASALADLAEQLGLNMDSFDSCVQSGRYEELVQANLEEGMRLGVQGTPTFFIDGYPVSGAQPFDLFTFAVELAEEGTLGDAFVRQEEPEPEPAPAGPVDVPVGDAYSIGDPDAPVTIVEYTDFQCPFCSRHYEQTFPQIKANYIDEGLVRYVFKDFPLTNIHPQAVLAAEAARCAGDQGAYAPMHDMLFANQNQWSGERDAADIFVGYAEELALDTTAFTTCLESNEYETAVMADLEEGVELGVRGTPAFFLNGRILSGAQPYEVFAQAIDTLLAEQ